MGSTAESRDILAKSTFKSPDQEYFVLYYPQISSYHSIQMMNLSFTAQLDITNVLVIDTAP
jgi:hypothetical protein